MLILIAESKTMTACDRPVAADIYAAHRPSGEEAADAVMTALRNADTLQID